MKTLEKEPSEQKSEKMIVFKEVPLAVFFDVESAFDKGKNYSICDPCILEVCQTN